jgi:hypothetical protein
VIPIRPTGYPTTPLPNPAADAARLAAQRAFFDQALGRAAQASKAQAPAVVQASAEPAPAVRAAPASAPTEGAAKLPRPGSLLDIRV